MVGGRKFLDWPRLGTAARPGQFYRDVTFVMRLGRRQVSFWSAAAIMVGNWSNDEHGGCVETPRSTDRDRTLGWPWPAVMWPDRWPMTIRDTPMTTPVTSRFAKFKILPWRGRVRPRLFKAINQCTIQFFSPEDLIARSSYQCDVHRFESHSGRFFFSVFYTVLWHIIALLQIDRRNWAITYI